MAETFNEMPFGECHYCGHKWQLDDWYDLDSGDSWTCPKCEEEFTVASVDTTVTMVFREKEPTSGKAGEE